MRLAAALVLLAHVHPKPLLLAGKLDVKRQIESLLSLTGASGVRPSSNYHLEPVASSLFGSRGSRAELWTSIQLRPESCLEAKLDPKGQCTGNGDEKENRCKTTCSSAQCGAAAANSQSLHTAWARRLLAVVLDMNTNELLAAIDSEIARLTQVRTL